jgi:hypothetical protein
MNRKAHWENVYQTKLPNQVSWHHTPFGTEQEFLYCYCRKLK